MIIAIIILTFVLISLIAIKYQTAVFNLVASIVCFIASAGFYIYGNYLNDDYLRRLNHLFTHLSERPGAMYHNISIIFLVAGVILLILFFALLSLKNNKSSSEDTSSFEDSTSSNIEEETAKRLQELYKLVEDKTITYEEYEALRKSVLSKTMIFVKT